MHFAKIAHSKRLQRCARFLGDGQWHSTRDIIYGASVCAVNDVILELEGNGFEIDRRKAKSETGTTITEYRVSVVPEWKAEEKLPTGILGPGIIVEQLSLFSGSR
jgi:hypothetical protein